VPTAIITAAGGAAQAHVADLPGPPFERYFGAHLSDKEAIQLGEVLGASRTPCARGKNEPPRQDATPQRPRKSRLPALNAAGSGACAAVVRAPQESDARPAERREQLP